MKFTFSFRLVFIAILFLFLSVKKDGFRLQIKGKFPSDWFHSQRAFPFDEIPFETWKQSMTTVRDFQFPKSGNAINPWLPAGPDNIGGRITDIEMPGLDYQTIYAGTASGGIFKSLDGGGSWNPIFDQALSLSIGDLAIAPSNPSVIYAGTGEANAGGGSVTYDGLGIYRSDDAGNTWHHLGLEAIGSVGRLAIDPGNPDIAYVAAMGRLFSNNPERGVYKTSDGGNTWQKVFYLNDSTGAVDILIHPDQPQTVYAATWERLRRPNRRVYGGEGCGIYKSTDGGISWTELSSGLPSGSNVGRIGISQCRNNPDVLYAVYADKTGYFLGAYRSQNGGTTWTQLNGTTLSSCFSSFGWWFGRIQADPVNPDVAYILGVTLHKTINGGTSWTDITGSAHVDQHTLHIHPVNSQFMVLGNDGGVYTSSTQGASWNFLQNLPVTQFYTCDVDPQLPERLYGGTQDNGTIRTLNGGISDWHEIYGGDGFRVRVDPQDNQRIYAEYQYGGFARSTDGGMSFQPATWGMNSADRFNWNCPYVIDPQNNSVLYFGSNVLYKSTDYADSWSQISQDMSNGPGYGSVVYGTITTISVSSVNSQIIWTGTDDGNVWVTNNGGNTWTLVTAGLPKRYITSVAADPFNPDKAWLSLSGYRNDEYVSHVFLTHNLGQTWLDISGNLPELPANRVLPNSNRSSCAFLATDGGVFYTLNDGIQWDPAGSGLPNVPVQDIVLHPATQTLVAATYGRSMYRLDLSPLSVPSIPAEDDRLEIRFQNNILSLIGKGMAGIFEIYTTEGKQLLTGKVPAGTHPYYVELPAYTGVLYVRFADKSRSTSAKILLIR